MNPLDMMKFSSLWSTFTANHPKFPKFIAAASRKGVLAEGSVIAMQITTPNGETLETNLKITEMQHLVCAIFIFQTRSRACLKNHRFIRKKRDSAVFYKTIDGKISLFIVSM